MRFAVSLAVVAAVPLSLAPAEVRAQPGGGRYVS